MADPTEKEGLASLTALTRNREAWPQAIPGTVAWLSAPAEKLRAKALWLLGEMGLRYPALLAPYVGEISDFLHAQSAILRERALNALGRIGRGDAILAEPYLAEMRLLAADAEPAVRLAFIWACENIATNAPELFANDMPLFATLLTDANNRVRREAPEIFRVLGKRKPEYVLPYFSRLQELSETDPERVVRIHAAGALRATNKAKGARDYAADE